MRRKNVEIHDGCIGVDPAAELCVENENAVFCLSCIYITFSVELREPSSSAPPFSCVLFSCMSCVSLLGLSEIDQMDSKLQAMADRLRYV